MPNPDSHSTLRLPKILKSPLARMRGSAAHPCLVPRQGHSLRTQLCLLSCFFVLFQLGLSCRFPISLRYWLDLKSTDIIWNMSDTGWIKAAIGSMFSSWLQGACVFVHRMAQFDTDTFLDVSHYFKLHIVRFLSSSAKP